MSRARLLAIAAGLSMALGASPTSAQTIGQRTTPSIGYIYPAGGQRGKDVTLSIGGERLNGASAAYCSIPGARLEITGYDRPLTQREFNDARDKQQVLQQKQAAAKTAPSAGEPPPAPWTPEDEKSLAEIKAMLAKRPVRLATPAIAETVTLSISLPPDARPGDHELRLLTPAGLSNPLLLQIGDLPEITDSVVTCTVNLPTSSAAREAGISPAKKNARMVSLPAVINGQILPGEVDRIRFAARQGQRITITAGARALIPYLADAVPGWFQAVLALHDPKGREIAYNDDYRFHPDPVLVCTIPADGDYTLEIRDAIYRGREDFIYRVTIGEIPFLASVFPLGGSPRPSSPLELAGWNLPADKLNLPASEQSTGTFLLSVRNSGHLSNSVRFAIDNRPTSRETEAPNDTREQAQPLSLPVIVDGRIERPDDRDFFSFEGRAGDQIIAEVIARRLASPLDSVLELSDSDGRRLAFNDDHEDKGTGLITHHADSRVLATLPGDGRYVLRISDTQHRGGQDFAYRLRLGPPQPDFELRVVPSTINARAGANVPLTVYAMRRDGFAGEILLGLKDAPRGYFLSGARIPAGQDSVRLTLTVPPTPLDQPMNLIVIGGAKIGSKDLIRAAAPADDMMQAFLYRHLVTAKDLKVCVTGRGSASRLSSPDPVKLPPGGETRLHITTQAARATDQVRVELHEPPDGITIKRTRPVRDGVEIVLSCDASKAQPGLTGNLIAQAFAERAAAKAGKQAQRVPLGTLPAIPFEIIAPARSTP